jgi:hypothetical protein
MSTHFGLQFVISKDKEVVNMTNEKLIRINSYERCGRCSKLVGLSKEKNRYVSYIHKQFFFSICIYIIFLTIYGYFSCHVSHGLQFLFLFWRAWWIFIVLNAPCIELVYKMMKKSKNSKVMEVFHVISTMHYWKRMWKSLKYFCKEINHIIL